MDIDCGAMKCTKKDIGQNTHKPSQNNKMRLKLIKPIRQLAIELLARGELAVQKKFRFKAVVLGPNEALGIFTIRNNKPVKRKPMQLGGMIKRLQV
jgi:hypothetical protein